MSEKGAAGGGLRERKKRATRAALAEAAVRLAAEHGAEKVTVEAISAAAGVSVRTFFNYFDSRDEAFVVIDADAGARMRTSMDHWSAHQEEAAFLDVFHEVFTLLAAGLPAPSA